MSKHYVKHCITICITLQAEIFYWKKKSDLNAEICITLCATKDDFVLQYAKQIWKGDFKAKSRTISFRAFTDKERRGSVYGKDNFNDGGKRFIKS